MKGPKRVLIGRWRAFAKEKVLTPPPPRLQAIERKKRTNRHRHARIDTGWGRNGLRRGFFVFSVGSRSSLRVRCCASPTDCVDHVRRERSLQFGVGLDEPGDVAQVLDRLARPPLRRSPPCHAFEFTRNRTGNGASHQKCLTDSSRSRFGLAWETLSIQARSASKGMRAARTSLAEQDWDAVLRAFQCGAAICTRRCRMRQSLTEAPVGTGFPRPRDLPGFPGLHECGGLARRVHSL
jgi:hypothetical protein